LSNLHSVVPQLRNWDIWDIAEAWTRWLIINYDLLWELL
jgi:hypothetical protein